MQYLLDSDTCIFALRDHPSVMKKLVNLPLTDWGISPVTAFELERGVAALVNQELARQTTLFIEAAEVLQFGAQEAKLAAQIEKHLKKLGRFSGVLDVFIAAHALSQGLILVTNNTRHFRNIPGLKLENWV